jgi:hypothetical protein
MNIHRLGLDLCLAVGFFLFFFVCFLNLIFQQFAVTSTNDKWLCVTTEVKLHCKVVFVSFYSNADYEGTHKHDDWYTIAIAFTSKYIFSLSVMG